MITRISDAELRRAHGALLRDQPRDRTTQRVSPERMLALVERRGTEAERLATLEAVMSDPESIREFEMLRALAAAHRADARQGSALRSPRAWVAVAAMLLVIAIPASRLVVSPSGGEPTRSALQSAVLVAPPENSAGSESRTFVWHPVAGAQAYRMELLTAAGSPVFTTRTTDTTVTLPSDVTIAPNVEHRWWVSTEMPDGTQRASAFRRLVLRDPK